MSLEDVKTVADLEKILHGAFLMLPRTMNPWEYFASQVTLIMQLKAPKSLLPMLICAACLLGIATVLYIAGLVIRWKKGTLWFIRVVRVNEEGFILPHYIVSYVSVMILFNLCLQAFLFILYVRTERQLNLHSYFYATSLPWLPGLLAVCFALWSLTTTWVLHLRAYNSSTRPWYSSALFINTLGISLPILALASLLPFGVIASQHLDDGMKTSIQLQAILSTGATAWRTSPTPDDSEIHLAAVLMFNLAGQLMAFQRDFELYFAILAGWCAFLGVAFVGIAIRYLTDLSKSINEMRGRTKTGVETFSRTWKWLVLVTVGLGTSMVALAINVSWIAATPEKILTDSVVNALSAVIPLYTVAILGLPVSSIILHNSLSTPSAKSLPSNSQLPSSISTTSSKGDSANLAQRYNTQFNLAAALPLNRFAFLTRPSSTHNRELEREIPFDSLELQPAPVYSRGGKSSGGIVVERMEETVTVVALPKEGAEVEDEMGTWKDDGCDDDKKW